MISKLPELSNDCATINQIIKYIEKHGTSDNLAEYLYKLTSKLNEVIEQVNRQTSNSHKSTSQAEIKKLKGKLHFSVSADKLRHG